MQYFGSRMKKASDTLFLTAYVGLGIAVIGFAVRYSLIDLSSRATPHGYRGEGMLFGFLGFVLFAYSAVRLARLYSNR